MNLNKLNIINTSNSAPHKALKTNNREETRAKFERMWLLDPSQFDLEKNIMGQEWTELLWSLIKEMGPLKRKKCVDLGCGNGVLAIKMAKAGAIVTGVDIASHALERLEKQLIPGVTTALEYLPKTTLPDNAFDLVIAKDFIPYLPENQFRLFFSEVARVASPEAMILLSTPLDIDSADALQKFISLAETELDLVKWELCHHALYIRLLRLIKLPGKFLKASHNPDYRTKELLQRKGVAKSWFRWNSSPIPALFWKGVDLMLNPLVNYLNKSKSALHFLEKLSKAINPLSTVSHLVIIGKRRPLVEPQETQRVVVTPRKPRIWE